MVKSRAQTTGLESAAVPRATLDSSVSDELALANEYSAAIADTMNIIVRVQSILVAVRFCLV